MRHVPFAFLLLATLVQADPGKALEHIARLDPAGKIVPLGAAEKKLLADARDGKLRTWTLEDAALVASGVQDAKKRKEYLATFEETAAAARRAIAEATTPREKAEALLRFLHGGPLKSYVRFQTRLDKFLDDGTYNCVSSAVLYNAVGARLGLDLRGVVIPGHAFCALADEDGKVDVETTTAEGFDPVRKKKRVVFVRRDEVVGVAMMDPTLLFRREIRDAGLVSVVYSNRAAAAARDKNYPAGALLGLRAMCLDRAVPTAGLAARTNLARWAVECLEQGRYEQGLLAATVGLDVAPKFAPLEAARKEIYQAWSTSLEKTRPDAAVEAMLRGVKDHPELAKELAGTVERGARRMAERVGPSEARAFLARSLKKGAAVEGVQAGVMNYVASLTKGLIGKGEFARAAVAVEEHASLLGRTAREAKERAAKLTHDVYEAWGKALVERKDWDAAARVYREALTLFPRDAAFKAGLDRVRSFRRA